MIVYVAFRSARIRFGVKTRNYMWVRFEIAILLYCRFREDHLQSEQNMIAPQLACVGFGGAIIFWSDCSLWLYNFIL